MSADILLGEQVLEKGMAPDEAFSTVESQNCAALKGSNTPDRVTIRVIVGDAVRRGGHYGRMILRLVNMVEYYRPAVKVLGWGGYRASAATRICLLFLDFLCCKS